MKLKKHIKHSNKKTIWRILLNGDGLVLIEERDLEKREVFFQCYSLENKKQISKNIQLEEKFWAGVEAFKDDVILFHGFVKPDMPWHKGIFAYSVRTNKLLWKNDEIVFAFIEGDKIIVKELGFEAIKYFSLDLLTGENLTLLEGDDESMKSRQTNAATSVDYSDYAFPNNYSGEGDTVIENLLTELKLEKQEVTEYMFFGQQCAFTLQTVHAGGLYNQKIFVVDIPSKNIIFNETLNGNQKTRLFDSYFAYKNFLIIICDKSEVIIYSY